MLYNSISMYYHFYWMCMKHNVMLLRKFSIEGSPQFIAVLTH